MHWASGLSYRKSEGVEEFLGLKNFMKQYCGQAEWISQEEDGSLSRALHLLRDLCALDPVTKSFHLSTAQNCMTKTCQECMSNNTITH